MLSTALSTLSQSTDTSVRRGCPPITLNFFIQFIKFARRGTSTITVIQIIQELNFSEPYINLETRYMQFKETTLWKYKNEFRNMVGSGGPECNGIYGPSTVNILMKMQEVKVTFALSFR